MLASVFCCLLLQDQPPKAKLKLPTGQPPPYALASLNEDGKSITLQRRYKVVAVEVPVVVTVKGDDGKPKQVTQMKRQRRIVEVGATRSSSVTVPYTVQVPFTEQVTDKDGNTRNVQRMRTETRMRTVERTDVEPIKPEVFTVAQCQFTDLSGKPVAAAEVARRLKNPSAILSGYEGLKFDPFYKKALNPGIIVVIPPEETPQDAPGTEPKRVGQPLPRTPNLPFALAKASADGRSIALVQKGGPRAVTRDQTYTVMAPVTEEVEDASGKKTKVTRMVPQKRTREIRMTVYDSGKPRVFRIAKCEFRDLEGKSVEPAEVARRLQNQSPILVGATEAMVEPYFKTALHPGTMIVTPPKPKP